MEIEVSQEQGRRPITVFRVRGEIDASSYEQLEQRARESFAAGMRDLVMDLSEVGYISSAGIRAINAIFKLLRSDTPDESDEAMKQGLRDGTFKSRHLKLLNPSSHVAKALGLAGVDMFLETHRNLKDAVDSF